MTSREQNIHTMQDTASFSNVTVSHWFALALQLLPSLLLKRKG